MQKISATRLARRTREVLDTVAAGETVMVERHRVSIAKIIPLERTMTALQAMDGLEAALTPNQAAAWLTESRKALDP
jgi:antitoxin (DNA-binding transcriptional repressor) of toxin-antitoxin stability system